MKRIHTTLLLFILAGGFCGAAGGAETDTAVLSRLVRDGIVSALEEHAGTAGGGTLVRIDPLPGHVLSRPARSTVEAAVSSAGFLITDSLKDADVLVRIAFPVARSVLVEDSGRYSRLVELYMSIELEDRASGEILWADMVERTHNDYLAKDERGPTDTISSLFPGRRRTVVSAPSSTLKIAGLAGLIGLLAYFAVDISN